MSPRRSMVRSATLLALTLGAAALLAVACGGGGASSTRQLTERERDSTLGKSAIPGGAAVTRALEASDSATTRAARENAAAGTSGQ